MAENLTVEERLAALEKLVAQHDAFFKVLPANNPILTNPSSLFSDQKDEYDDPRVVIEPNRWKGPSYKGKRFSECPTEYLQAMVEFLNWCIQDDQKTGKLASNGKPRYVYRQMDRDRALKWIERKKVEANAPPDPSSFTFEDVEPQKK